MGFRFELAHASHIILIDNYSQIPRIRRLRKILEVIPEIEIIQKRTPLFRFAVNFSVLLNSAFLTSILLIVGWSFFTTMLFEWENFRIILISLGNPRSWKTIWSPFLFVESLGILRWSIIRMLTDAKQYTWNIIEGGLPAP